MHTVAPDLHGLVVEVEAGAGIELRPAKTDGNRIRIDGLIANQQLDLRLVESRRLDGPELGIRHRDSMAYRAFAAGRDVAGSARAAVHESAARIVDTGLDLDGGRGGPEVFDFGGCRDRGRARAYGRGRDEPAIEGDMDRIEGRQPDVEIDATASVPAAVGLLVVDADRDDVRAAVGLHILGKVILKRRVSVGPRAERSPVDPHLAVHIDAVEFDKNPLSGIGRIESEGLSVPAHAPVHESRVAAAGRALVESKRRAPVMGDGQARPCGVAEAGLLGAGGITKVEFPTVVEALAALAVVGLNESAAATACSAARVSTRASGCGAASAAGRFSTRASVRAAGRASTAAGRASTAAGHASLRVPCATAVRIAGCPPRRSSTCASARAAGRTTLGTAARPT